MFEFVEGYFITENGEVYNKKTGRKRVPQMRNDYLSVNIKGKNYTIHRTVALSFVPNPDNLPVVRHLDGNKFNNNYSNLAWGSTQDNAADAIGHGTHTCLNSNAFKESQNVSNRPAKVSRKRNTDLPMGVSERINVTCVKYIAKMSNEKCGQTYLGSFDTPEEAYAAVKSWYFEQYGTYPGK